MQWLRNLPISRKFILAFGIVCGLCIVLGAFTFITFRSIAAKSADVSRSHFPSLVNIGTIRNGVSTERREDLELMLCQTPACTSDHLGKRQMAIVEYKESLKTIDLLIIPQEREQYEKFTGAIKQYQDASDRGVGLLTAGKAGDALDLLSSDATMTALSDALTAADTRFLIHAKLGTEASDGATEASVRATWIRGHCRFGADGCQGSYGGDEGVGYR
jgi:methyl-accepting chemotaxis protein